MQLVSQIDPVHSAIHILNNRGQMKKVTTQRAGFETVRGRTEKRQAYHV